MPGRDGKGPMGMGQIGRRMGPCYRNMTPVNNEQKTEGQEPAADVAYGAGRGGKPRGCGMGFCGGRRGRRA